MTSTTTSITANADGTVDIGGNLFKLDALIESYSSILEQAKQQLESLELNDSQINSITSKAINSIDYYKLSRVIPFQLTNGLEGDESLVLDKLANVIQNKIDTEHIRSLIRSEMRHVVDERFDDLKQSINVRFETLTNNEATDARIEARASTRMFEELFRTTFGQEIKDHIKREANELAEDWQKRRAELDAAGNDQ
jgi:hypothetical protein